MRMTPHTPGLIDEPETSPATQHGTGGSLQARLLFVIAGALLGIVFVKSEVLSWYRIQEMFRFQSAHMYP